MGIKSFLVQQEREVPLHSELEEVFSRDITFISLFFPLGFLCLSCISEDTPLSLFFSCEKVEKVFLYTEVY